MDGPGRRVRRFLGNAVTNAFAEIVTKVGGADRPRRVALANGLGVTTLTLLGAWARFDWPFAPISGLSWWVAAACLLFASMILWFHASGPRSAGGWLWLIGNSVLLAAMFWAANQGLDLIKPSGSRRTDAASTVGGFELWALLCPGLTIVGVAGWVRSLALRTPGRWKFKRKTD